MPAAQPFGVTDLLLGFGSLLLVSGAPVTTVSGEDVAALPPDSLGGELRDGSPLQGWCVSCAHCTQTTHCPLISCLRAVEKTLGPERRFLRLTRRGSEMKSSRSLCSPPLEFQWDLWHFLVVCSPAVSCGSIFGAFRADTNFLFAAQGREAHQVHKFATDEGQTGRFEYREILIEVQIESEL